MDLRPSGQGTLSPTGVVRLSPSYLGNAGGAYVPETGLATPTGIYDALPRGKHPRLIDYGSFRRVEAGSSGPPMAGVASRVARWFRWHTAAPRLRRTGVFMAGSQDSSVMRICLGLTLASPRHDYLFGEPQSIRALACHSLPKNCTIVSGGSDYRQW